MRDIEFRAWLKNSNKMVEVKEIIFYPEKQIAYDAKYRNGKSLPFHYLNYKLFDEIELMQYTGLKDKNGVKIFEGDIVEFDGDEIGVIKYTDGCFEIEADGFTETFYYNRYGYEVEVIGNIYEDKELLKNE